MSSAIRLDPDLLTDLQTHGVRLQSVEQEHNSRRGGAGPSDHQALVIGDQAVMVPVHTSAAHYSPYTLTDSPERGTQLQRDGIPLLDVSPGPNPNFYRGRTADGVPYAKIATLHGRDVLATTVLQTCIRYERRSKACKFCAIGQSLAADRTVAYKTPAMLAEVARAAVQLDGVRHMVMTTGTPKTPDRGAALLCDSVAAVKAAVDIPIQVQCEPPDDNRWFQRLRDAGADALGMHVEVVTPQLRQQLLPGKAEVPLDTYLSAFDAAVAVFGRGQVSTYILAGLGDSSEAILELSATLIGKGVYPFVVPFVPIRGTPLEDHPPPSSEFMQSILKPLGRMLMSAELHSADIKAGCGRCGACSSLNHYESDSAET